ncbi:MAG: zinc-binding alcohol dehydrogenase [Planctomycetota bacterium]|nr:zinc-binding alcohol dehydrogenase [Planctomycetota bacterium]
MQAQAVVPVDPRRVEFRTIEIGEPGPNELLVELECSAISVGTESYIISMAEAANPRVLGYSPVGRITRVGEGVGDRFAVGERVTYFSPRAPVGVGQLCGGHQSPAILNVDPTRDLFAPNCYVVKVPESVPSEKAAFAGISAVSYFGATMPNPQPGDRVVVVGQGIIGLFATRHFALRGCRVVVADSVPARLAAAKALGADHVVDVGKGDLVKFVRDLWPDGADIVVDSTANHRVVETAIGALRGEGKFVFLGYYKGADFNLGRLHGVVYEGFFPWTLRGRHVAASLKLMAMGVLDPLPLISHRFPARDAAKAFEMILTPAPGNIPANYLGVLLDWRR